MTSSLVGSEMCIRDRTRSVQECCRRRAACVLYEELARVPLVSSRDVDTVSYTHLTLPTICSV
eukprot:6245816-Prorocentrum_lima.AAC.1